MAYFLTLHPFGLAPSLSQNSCNGKINFCHCRTAQMNEQRNPAVQYVLLTCRLCSFINTDIAIMASQKHSVMRNYVIITALFRCDYFDNWFKHYKLVFQHYCSTLSLCSSIIFMYLAVIARTHSLAYAVLLFVRKHPPHCWSLLNWAVCTVLVSGNQTVQNTGR